MLRKLTLLISLMVVIALMLACAAPASAPGEEAAPAEEQPAATEAPAASGETDESTLVLGIEGSPPSFDPLGASDDSRVDTPSLNFYNALVQVSPGTTEVELELADSYEISDDGLTYTFKLHEGVMFHDGTELTAEDVKYTIDRMLALQKGIYRSLSAVTGAEIIDDYTVAIHLSEPFPALLQAMSRLYILNGDLVQANEDQGDWGEKWLVENEAGSGPYQLAFWEREQQFVGEKFDDYFKGWEGPHAERVIFRIYKEESTRRLALEQGEADWVLLGSADTWEALRDVEGIKLYSDPTLNQLYIAFNTNNENLQDPRVREALSLVYDYQGHVESVRNGRADVARGPLPPSIPCFDEDIPTAEMDLERAKELIAEAGYPDGGFELSIAYQGTSPEETAVAQIMQAGAAEIGVTVRPTAMEWPAKVNQFSAPETAPGMGTIWMYPNYPDPDEFLHTLAYSENAGEGGLNFAYYANEEMDQLLSEARTETDPEARCSLYEQAQQIWQSEMPYANLVIGHALSAAQENVMGYQWTPSHAFTVNAYEMYKE